MTYYTKEFRLFEIREKDKTRPGIEGLFPG